jgi:hypothetical protein
MKKALLLLLFFSHHAFSQTNVSGFINANTNWTVAGSPYIVIGNALLSQGYTLTIDPGVIVKFNDSTALQIDGTMIAIGTVANRIIFTSNQLVPAAGDWAKLHFSSYCIGATYDTVGNYVSGSILKYCDVLYGGQLGYGEIHIESSWPYVSQCNIKYSGYNGIFCSGSTFILDSSLVSDNARFGLYFNQFSQFSCGLMINGDTIRNNSLGGLFLGSSSTSCSTTVKNCYFISNLTQGAIRDSATVKNVTIKNNYFISNVASTFYRGVITFENPTSVTAIDYNTFLNNSSSNQGIIYYRNSCNNSRFENNYFNTNNSFEATIKISSTGSNNNIRKNLFINNTSQWEGMIYFANTQNKDSISCNRFITNRIKKAVIGFDLSGPSDATIQHNLFEGNYNTAINGVGILEISQSINNNILDFSNNIVKNDTTINGKLVYIYAYLDNNTERLKIYNNEFKNNNSNKIINLTGPLINNSSLNFMYFKHNNFLDSANEFTLYNEIPYGSPNIKADSNYWGSMSTQHVDSVVFDYFDFANQSVVYYLPILPDFNVVDTTCPLLCYSTATIMNNVNCNGGSNGKARVTPTGGTAPFTYSWTPSGGSGATASNLTAGTYICYITDANGCITSPSVNITEPLPLTATVTVWNDVSCYNGSNGCATVHASGGDTLWDYLYIWSPNGGYDSTSCILAAGNYTVTVSDNAGCTVTATLTITQPPQLYVIGYLINNVPCYGGFGGSATVGPYGGSPPYTYLWLPTSQPTQTALNLYAANYLARVTDSHGCIATASLAITQPTQLVVNVNVMDASCSSCSDGSATASASGGTPGYSYSWSPSGGNGPSASNLLPGNYTCCVTDANGCTQCSYVTVSYPTAINEADLSDLPFSIFPNPSHNAFTISHNNQLSIINSQLTIFDITGRVIHQQILTSAHQQIINHFSPGIYFVKVNDGERVFTEKIIVE